MSVSHAPSNASTRGDDTEIPRLLDLLATVPDPRKRRGRRYGLVFVLAVAVVTVLAGATNFREIGDHAGDLPQELLAALGGQYHPLRQRVVAPSEKRIRTLLQQIDANGLDEIIGAWLGRLADAGRLEEVLTAVTIDGKWLRGVADVALFSAMRHEEKIVIAQRIIPRAPTRSPRCVPSSTRSTCTVPW